MLIPPEQPCHSVEPVVAPVPVLEAQGDHLQLGVGRLDGVLAEPADDVRILVQLPMKWTF